MNYITPLTIRLVGSLHCIGLCGPIALALPLGGSPVIKRIGGLLIYNIGRIITYALMGTIFGILGKSFYIAGIQRQISVFLGIMILLGLFVPYVLSQKNKLTSIWFKVFGKLYQEMGSLIKNGSFLSLFVVGFINGFLPCGLVYLALAGALAQSEVIHGSIFMIMLELVQLPQCLE